MPELSPAQAESHTTPRREKQGGSVLPIHPPTTQLATMTKDDSARAQQHQNDLKAFLDYERRLSLAYAKSQDPHPRRWLREDSSR